MRAILVLPVFLKTQSARTENTSEGCRLAARCLALPSVWDSIVQKRLGMQRGGVRGSAQVTVDADAALLVRG